MSRLKPFRTRRFSFEALENRSLLAGNVNAAVNAGELDITGDNANNNIQVTQLTSGQWRVTGIATQINGGNAAFTTDSGNPVTGNIVINLSGGSDTLKVSNGTVPGALLISADDTPPTSFDGNDNVQVSNVTTGLDAVGSGNSLIIALGRGSNTAKLSGVTTSGSTDVESENGNNQISMSNVTVNGGDGAFNGIFPGQGTSVISLSNVKMTSGDNGVNEIDLLLPGKTTISLSKVSMTVGDNGLNGILTHGPQSTIILSNVTMTGGDHSDNTINPGAGTSVISLSNVNMTTGDNSDGNRILAGPGIAVITLSNVKMVGGVDSSNLLATENGTSAISLSHVTMTNTGGVNEVDTGDGAAAISLSNVQMTADINNVFAGGSGNVAAVISFSKVNMTASDGGENQLATSGGSAVISLSNVSMNGSGSSDNQIRVGKSTGSSNTVLVAVNLTMHTNGGSGASNNIGNGDGTFALSLANWKVDDNAEIDVGDGRHSIAVAGANVGGKLEIDGGSDSDAVALAKVAADAFDISLRGGNDVLTLVSCTANTATFDGGDGNNTLVRVHDSLGAQSVTNFQHQIG